MYLKFVCSGPFYLFLFFITIYVIYILCFYAGNLYFNIFRGPLEILMGLFGGLVVGLIFWYLPAKNGVSNSQFNLRSDSL